MEKDGQDFKLKTEEYDAKKKIVDLYHHEYCSYLEAKEMDPEVYPCQEFAKHLSTHINFVRGHHHDAPTNKKAISFLLGTCIYDMAKDENMLPTQKGKLQLHNSFSHLPAHLTFNCNFSQNKTSAQTQMIKMLNYLLESQMLQSGLLLLRISISSFSM